MSRKFWFPVICVFLFFADFSYGQDCPTTPDQGFSPKIEKKPDSKRKKPNSGEPSPKIELPPLHGAARDADIPTLKELLEKGENANSRDRNGIRVDKTPDALFFKDLKDFKLNAWICSTCGYTELYLDQPKVLQNLLKDLGKK